MNFKRIFFFLKLEILNSVIFMYLSIFQKKKREGLKSRKYTKTKWQKKQAWKISFSAIAASLLDFNSSPSSYVIIKLLYYYKFQFC